MATTTVSPELPLWVQDTLEYDLLTLMIPVFVDRDGVSFGGPVYHDDYTPSSAISISKVAEMVAKAREGDSSLIRKIVAPLERLLERVKSEKKPFFFIDMLEFSSDVDIAGDGSFLEVDHVLHSLCERFPEEIPFIEVAWGYGDRKAAHGNFGGGAAFITPEGVELITTHGFLKEKRTAFENRPTASSSPKPLQR
jgi:hypothetical protein